MPTPLRFGADPAHTTSQFRALTAKSVQPARRSRGPMRDVERRFALPWSIYSLNSMASSRYQIRQRFRIELRKKVRVGRLVKVLSIFRHATEGTANSHGFFEGGTESAAPFEGSTSRKIAMRIPGASRSIGRGGAENLRATCRQEPLHCRVRP